MIKKVLYFILTLFGISIGLGLVMELIARARGGVIGENGLVISNMTMGYFFWIALFATIIIFVVKSKMKKK